MLKILLIFTILLLPDKLFSWVDRIEWDKDLDASDDPEWDNLHYEAWKGKK